MTVGDLYNASNVKVGQACLYVAPINTPMPADSSVLFDPTNWTGKILTANSATSVTLTIATVFGTVSTAAMATFGSATAATVDTAIETALATLPNYTIPTSASGGGVKVTGVTGGPFTLLFDQALGAVVVTAVGTGGTPTLTGGLWTPAGASDQGWSFGGSKNVQTIRIEEQSTPVGRFIVDQDVSITGTFAEDVMLSWQIALNMSKAVTAVGTGITPKIRNTMTDALVHYAVALEMSNEIGFARRAYIPDTVSTNAVTIGFRRASDKRMIPVGFGSVCQTNQIVVDDIRGLAN